MMHSPIFFNQLTLSFTDKICFEDFATQLHYGSRVAIIGRNGCGKSSLLNIVRGVMEPSSGDVTIPDGMRIGYVEQTIDDYPLISGGQRFNKRLSQALAMDPDILLLDEPTNHLDSANRKSLMKMLQSYQGTLLIVTHDAALIRACTECLWHIDNKRIAVFTGNYDDYVATIQAQRQAIESSLVQLKRDKKLTHQQLMQAQKRAATSKAKGQKHIDQRKWPTIVSKAKVGRGTQTSDKKASSINQRKAQLSAQIEDLNLPEMITPKFSWSSHTRVSGVILSIQQASIAYHSELPVLQNINLTVNAGDHIAITGKNGVGKSTLLQAILGKNVVKTGEWQLPSPEDIGYLDQHYRNLNDALSVLQYLAPIRPDWTMAEVRKHLNDFLFRSNDEVNRLIAKLSGGEKARLSLAAIAANVPKLLLLDEPTNNLDMETKSQLIKVLKDYPGALIVVSHEDDFIAQIQLDYSYALE